MFKASIGGGAAAHTVYRHALTRVITDILGPLNTAGGWSAASVAIAAILMSWDAGPTLAQRFDSALAVLDAALPRRLRTGRTYQGLVKALHRRSDGLLDTLVPRLRERTRRAAGQGWKIGRFVPIAVDGSRFDAPRTIGNEPLGFAGKDKCSPQMMTVLLVHLGSMLPWAFGIAGVRTSERAILRALLGTLPDDALLVADAGYTGFDLLGGLDAAGVRFLVRVGRNVRLLTGLGDYRCEGEDTVYLWPDAGRGRPPLTLRLIRVGKVWLVTNVLDRRHLPKGVASEFYRRRWGVEVAFRSLKQTLARRKVRSQTAENARRELAWSIAGIWTLMLIGAAAIRRAGHAAERLSVAGALRAVRSPRATASARALSDRLRRALRDGYTRRAPKRSYNRAAKKRCSPPGRPILTRATAAQAAQAKGVRAKAE